MIAPAGIRKISDPLESLAMEFSEGCLTADEKKGRGWASVMHYEDVGNRRNFTAISLECYARRRRRLQRLVSHAADL